MIAVIDYKAGNLTSVVKALTYLGAQTQVTQDADVVRVASKIVLPGVGHFQATALLQELGITEAVREAVGKGAEFLGVEFLAAGLGGDGDGDFHAADFQTVALAGVREGETDLVAGETIVARGLGHIARSGIFSGRDGVEPAGIEHKGRARDDAAAAVEPLALRARDGPVGGEHLRDLPRKLDSTGVASFQLGPHGLGPETPGRGDFEVVGDFHTR